MEDMKRGLVCQGQFITGNFIKTCCVGLGYDSAHAVMKVCRGIDEFGEQTIYSQGEIEARSAPAAGGAPEGGGYQGRAVERYRRSPQLAAASFNHPGS
jgi:hypothetical protein